MAAVALQPRATYRYVLRRDGVDLTHPSGRLLVYPSYMAALRGRAMRDDRAHIIQQEAHDDET